MTELVQTQPKTPAFTMTELVQTQPKTTTFTMTQSAQSQQKTLLGHQGKLPEGPIKS